MTVRKTFGQFLNNRLCVKITLNYHHCKTPFSSFASSLLLVGRCSCGSVCLREAAFCEASASLPPHSAFSRWDSVGTGGDQWKLGCNVLIF